jgi:hypothetical protein
MRVRFLAAASEEFSHAVSYYDSQKQVWVTSSPTRYGEQSPGLLAILSLGCDSRREPDAVLPNGSHTE